MAASRMAPRHAAARTSVPPQSTAAAAPRGHADQRVARLPLAVGARVPLRLRGRHRVQRSGLLVLVVRERFSSHNPRAITRGLYDGMRAAVLVKPNEAVRSTLDTIHSFIDHRFWVSSTTSSSTGSSTF